MNDTDYRPSYFFPTDEQGREPVSFDFLIAHKDGLTWHYAAWGDGSHVNQVAATGFNDEPIKTMNYAYHVGELEKFFRSADALVAIRDHKVVYKKGA